MGNARVILGLGLVAALSLTGCPRRGPSGAQPVTGPLSPADECARVAGRLLPAGQAESKLACDRLSSSLVRSAQAGGLVWVGPADPGGVPAAADLSAALDAAYAALGQPAPAGPVVIPVLGRMGPPPAAVAQGLGQAFAASAVAWWTPDGPRVAPVMPLASRLSLAAPEGLPLGADPALVLAAAVLAQRADASFARADFAGACILGRAALERMPAGQGACSARGPLLYLIWKAARLGGCEQDQAVEQLRKECADAELPQAEQAAQAFYGLLVELESKRGSGWSQDEFPEEWAARKDRQAALAALRVRAAPLSGPRRELILGLLDEIEAFVLRPSGPCDTQTPARREAELTRVADLLHRLGRGDLSSHVPGGGPDPKAGPVDPDYLDRQRAFALTPENLWRRKELLGSLLMHVWAAFKVNPDPVLTQPVCRDFFGELERRVEQDTWPDRADRNLGLLSGSFLAAVACPDRTALQALFQGVLDQAEQGEQGKLGVLAALASLLPNLVAAALTGQTAQLLATLEHMHAAVLERVDKLSASAEDRVLGACLQAFLALQPLLQGRTDEVIDRIDRAEQELGKLPFPPPTDAPRLVRLAPGLHLAAGYLLAGAYALGDRTEVVAALLARMRPNLERAVPYTLRTLDAGEHAEAAVKVSLALQGLLEHLAAGEQADQSAGLAQVVAGIERAWPALPERGGWWQVGLVCANLLLSDYLALAYDDDLGPVAEARLLARSGTELQRLVDGARIWFDLAGPDFDFVRLLPVAHGVLELAMALPADRPDRLTEALSAIEPRLEQTLAALAPQRTPDARLAYLVERGSLPGLLMEAVWTAREVGWQKLIRARAVASKPLLNRLERIDGALGDAGRVELKLLLDLMMGALFQLAGQADQAQAWLARAAGSLDDTDLVDAFPYVLASRAAVVAQRDPLAARRLLREAMAPGREARKCGRTHPVDALGLPLAWLAARSGDHALALAQVDAYLERMAAGFEGEGRLKCQYKFHGDQLIVQTTIEVALANLIHPISNDSSWQVGAGAQSLSVDRESLVCFDLPFGHRRHDRQLNAELIGAIYALLQGDDPAADGYLRRALMTLKRIDHGSRATLEVFDADGLEPSREKQSAPLMYWAGVLAQLRGHTAIGGILELRAGRPPAEDLEDQLSTLGLLANDPPGYLAGVPGVAELRPLLERWYLDWVRRKGPSKELLAQIAAATKRMPKVIPAWSPSLVQAAWLVGEGQPEKAFEVIKTSPPDYRRHWRVGLVIRLLGQVLNGPTLKAGDLSLEFERVVAAGYLPEALEAADVLMADLVKREGPAAAERLDRALRGTKPEALDAYSAGQADLLLAQVYLAKGELARVRQLLLANLERHNGLFPLQQQLGREWEVIHLGLQLGLHAPTLERIQARLPLFGRALGFDSQAVLELEVRALALQILLAHDYDPALVDRLIARAAGFGPAVEASSKFLQSLEDALSANKDPIPLCRDFLKT